MTKKHLKTKIKKKVVKCPTCGKDAKLETIEWLGECLACDHVRGEVLGELVCDLAG